MSSPFPNAGDPPSQRAVFLSYAREDAQAAQRIADALGSHGVEVWLDQSELRGGDAWDQKIRRQIKECVLFVPIISVCTQARGEGYFRLEWKLAVERTHLMAEGVPFLSPVVVDDTLEGAALVPAEFLRVQWVRLPGALPTPSFVAQIKRMLEAPRVSGNGSSSAAGPATAAAASRRPSRAPSWAMGALAAAILAVAVAIVLTRHPPAAAPTPLPSVPASPQTPAVDAKSIAVLPFENMSEEKENAFFADGVHEDVLTNLSFIKDLHLVSRTSVMQYRGTTKSVKQIGQELGVAYVLEGSVRREGNKVRVTGQLIDARTDEHVWAKAYDRDLTDIFAIQAELAQAIADALKSVLSPETRVLLARRPTESTEAYDDYVKAWQLRSSAGFGNIEPATALLKEAVRLDPNFAQAWAELASIMAFGHFTVAVTDEQVRSAKEAMDNALRLAPDDPVVIEGLGDFYYYGYRDYPRATEQYMRLSQMKPNDPTTYSSLGLIQRRQGRILDAIANLSRAVDLDPGNYAYLNALQQTLSAARRFDDADAVIVKFLGKSTRNLEALWLVAQNDFYRDGSTTAIKDFARRTPDPSEESKFIYMQSCLAYFCGDWAECIRLDHLQRYYDGDPDASRWVQDTVMAEALAESGDLASARTRAAEALALMKTELKRQPENSVLWANMGLAQALLGNRDETLRCAQKAAEYLPESRDAIIGPTNSVVGAQAFAWVGEKERALSEFQRLLHMPWGTLVANGRNSWRPIRDDPRFKALLADPANNAPLD
jgi:TolB-like protein/Tfp pilus assembly protein PilF